jgi:uncharacterized HAD superfamily protein/hypoxanthine-guanine phosphoribosyltransferase
MYYKSYFDLSQDIRHHLYKIPTDVTLVVGIPRSGLLAANIIALYLNLPLTDIDSFINGNVLSAGKRGEQIQTDPFEGTILIVDDSLLSGSALKKAKEKLQKIEHKNYKLLYCCVYAVPEAKNMIDIPLVLLDQPRIFEWNIFHHPMLNNACVDIDGVLCIDPTEEENDDGKNYLRFLESAPTRFVPTVKLGSLVTSRLEKYRPETEKWLAKHNIRYNELLMLDLPDKESRIRLGSHATFKAGNYKRLKQAGLFVESSREQAVKIFELTSKPVYCVDTNEMFTTAGTVKSLVKKEIKNKGKRIKSLLKKILKKMHLLNNHNG